MPITSASRLPLPLGATGWLAAAATGAFPAAAWLGAGGGVLLNVFSNALNQIHDIEIDRINKPDRPLPAARMSAVQARLAAVLCLAGALGAAALVSPRLVAVFAAAALCTWLYSAPPARLKRHWLPAHLVMAVARGLLIPVAGWAAVAPLDRPDPWAAGAVLGLFVFGAAGTKDFDDVPGDRAHGIATLPVAFGPAAAARIIAPFLVAPFLLTPALAAAGLLHKATYPLAALAIYGAYVAALMIRQYSGAAPNTQSRTAWVHMYILLMLAQVGFAVCYSL